LVAVVAAISLLLVGCAPVMFSDSEAITRTDPPQARNHCEEVFATQLTAELGIAETPPRSPEQSTVIAVMDDCTADELLEADDYFSFGVGGPMTRLLARRLFNGPDRSDQLVQLCRQSPYEATRACRTIDVPLG
jgi:hypothetical protein